MVNPYSILIADHELNDRCQALSILMAAGFQVSAVENCDQALDALSSQSLSLAITAIDLPGEPGGLDLCRRARRDHHLPVILLVRTSCEQDFLDGFAAGTSDCVVKPVRSEELLARVRILLARSAAQPGAPDGLPARNLHWKGLVLDTAARLLHCSGKVVHLSPIEFRLLRFFMQHPGEVVNKEDLLRIIWGYQITTGDLNLVESAIRRLRKVIEDDPKQPVYLHTIWGVGYRFGSPSPEKNQF